MIYIYIYIYISTVPTVLLGTVDEHSKMLYEYCKNIVEKRAQINDREKIKIKKAMNSTY